MLSSQLPRLSEQLSKYRDSLFTFLDRTDIPFEDNFAKRQTRPAGGNLMGGDGHVDWKDFSEQKVRLSTDTPWGESARWW